MFKKSKLAFLVLIIMGLGIFGPLAINTASAGLFDPAEPLEFKPQISILEKGITSKGGAVLQEASTVYIAQYVKAIYDYGLSIVGILATIILMAGGYLWAMSGGDATKITHAKEMITGAIVGMLILLASVTILGRINPELVDFKISGVIELDRKAESTHCDPIKGPSNKMLSLDTKECAEGSDCTQTNQVIYDSDPKVKKNVNEWLCLDFSKNDYICCQYENSIMQGRPCITYNKGTCASKASPGGQELENYWPNKVCNIPPGSRNSRDCYSEDYKDE